MVHKSEYDETERMKDENILAHLLKPAGHHC